MSLDREKKQEASVPIQSRISVISLAELDMYWMSEGNNIRTMSRLVAWGIELLCEVLRSNGKLPHQIDSITEANNYLLSRNLYQPSLRKRSFQKIGTAITFEGMRDNGDDPSVKIGSGKDIVNSNVTRKYNMLHNEKSVEPYNGSIISDKVRRATEIYNSLKNVEPIISQQSTNHIDIKDKMSQSEIDAKAAEIKAHDDEEQRLMDEFLAS